MGGGTYYLVGPRAGCGDCFSEWWRVLITALPGSHSPPPSFHLHELREEAGSLGQEGRHFVSSHCRGLEELQEPGSKGSSRAAGWTTPLSP